MSTTTAATPTVPAATTVTPPEKEKTFFEKYGIYVASLGFGLAFLFLGIIIYLLVTRTSSPEPPRPRLPMSIPSAPVSALAVPATSLSASQTAPPEQARDMRQHEFEHDHESIVSKAESFDAAATDDAYEEMLPDEHVRSPLSSHYPSSRPAKPVSRMDGGYCGEYCGAGRADWLTKMNTPLQVMVPNMLVALSEFTLLSIWLLMSGRLIMTLSLAAISNDL